MTTMEYSAFLSYSRKDDVIGAKIEKDLQQYRIPRKYRPDAGKGRFNIFRDVHDAELGEYNEVIDKALQASKFLIILCSPSARDSEYVTNEIKNFVEHHEKDCVIPVLVDGRPNKEVKPNDPDQNQAFPNILYEYFEEPIAADFRPKKGEGYFAKRRRQREAFFQIVAKLLRQPKSDKLVRRDRRKRQLIASISTIIIVLSVSFIGWFLYDRMPKSGLDPIWLLTKSEHNEHIKSGLNRISRSLEAEVPKKGDSNQLLIATWNIREFATNKRSPSPPRSTEALAYIALIISHFDIVALQELTGNAIEFETAKQKLLDRLGSHWQYAGSGVTEGRLGNRERLGFLFDTRGVQRTGDFDEIVLPKEVMKSVELDRQISRTPVIAEFRTGDHKISLTNAHMYYGMATGEKRKERLREFTALIKYLRFVLKGRRLPSDYLILLGDLNFDRPNAPEASVAQEAGFTFPKNLLTAPTNHIKRHPYDQIILSWNAEAEGPCVISAGVFDVFDSVYRDEDFENYVGMIKAEITNSKSKSLRKKDPMKYFRHWRTFKMSDHFPKWIALDFDCR
jgi:endonuclease/exonuclease/phosphatase family metal-dependent hydrolase